VGGFGEVFDGGQAAIPLGGDLGHGLAGLVETAGLDLVQALAALLAPADETGALSSSGQAGSSWPVSVTRSRVMRNQ